MIRSFPIGPGAEAYHLGIVAEGVEGPGRWTGTGAEGLGLVGVVGREQLAAVLNGRHPSTGTELRVRPVKVRGVELTFQVAKSVSVLWAVAGPDVAGHIDAGRRAALDAAVSYLEEEALVLGTSRDAAGMVGAAFHHRTSRSGDPHLHSHLVVANLGRSRSGRWMAVDRLALDRHLHTAGHLFEAHLRHELTVRLGVRFGAVRAGVAQLDGVPDEVRRLFSRRRLQVEAVMAAHGGASPAAARLAAVIGRPGRHPGLAAELLAPEWAERARSGGFDRLAARRLLGRAATAPDRSPPDPAALGLADRSTFSRREVLEAVCAARPEGLPGREARVRAGEVVAGPGVVRVAGRPALRRRDVLLTGGRMVVVHTDRERWTTREDLVMRQRAAELARASRGRGRAALGDAAVEGLAGEGLPGPERDVARGLVACPDGVQLLAAPPGPERERVLAACRAAWASGGVRVLGVAADAEAAARLRGATGIESAAVEEVTAGLEPLAGPVVTPTVLTVTGAEQLSAARLVDLLETADRTRVGVVLVADTNRVPEVDRSGGWSAVAGVSRCQVLERGREGGAVGRAGVEGRGPAEPVFRVGDRLSLAASPEALRGRLVGDWFGSWTGGGGAVMVAAPRRDVDDLNHRARVRLSEEGRLRGPETDIGGLPARAGDHVVVASVDARGRRDGWALGQGWLVGPGSAALSGPGGTVRPLPAAGVTMRWGYAATPYQAARAGLQDWLVLGEPASLGRAACPATARFYVVAGIDRAARLATGVARTADRGPERADVLGHAAAVDPPAYLLGALGAPPRDIDGRRTWLAAAGAVEGYRRRWGVTDRDRPLGPECGPGTGSEVVRRAQRQEAARQLGAAAVTLGRDRRASREVGPEMVLGRVVAR